MFSEEIKQVVYIAVTCILLAIVLTFASNLVSIKQTMVSDRNNALSTQRQVVEANKFSKYNDKTVTGIDVIDAIAEYKKTDGFQVLVFRDSVGSYSLYNKTKYESNPNLFKLAKLQSVYKSADKYQAYVYANLPDLSLYSSSGYRQALGTAPTTSSLLDANRVEGAAQNINTIVFIKK